LKRILRAFRWGVGPILGESFRRRTPPVNVNTVSGLLLGLLGLVETWLILDLQRVLAGFGLAYGFLDTWQHHVSNHSGRRGQLIEEFCSRNLHDVFRVGAELLISCTHKPPL